MSEKVLGVVLGVRSPRSEEEENSKAYVLAHETLSFTSDEVIVTKTKETHFETKQAWWSPWSGVTREHTQYRNDKFTIPNSEIIKVELVKRLLLWKKIHIVTSKKKYKWFARGIPDKKHPKFEDYENMLRPIFGDKLSVKK